MHSQEDGPGIIYMGGGLAAIAVLIVIVKAVSQFLAGLSIALSNFGKMMGSMVFLLWNTFEVVLLLTMIACSIVGGVYFVYRYFRAMKELTDNRAWLENQLYNASLDVEVRALAMEKDLKERVDSVIRRVDLLDSKLTEALKKPEVAPPTADNKAESPAASEASPAIEWETRDFVSCNPF